MDITFCIIVIECAVQDAPTKYGEFWDVTSGNVLLDTFRTDRFKVVYNKKVKARIIAQLAGHICQVDMPLDCSSSPPPVPPPDDEGHVHKQTHTGTIHSSLLHHPLIRNEWMHLPIISPSSPHSLRTTPSQLTTSAFFVFAIKNWELTSTIQIPTQGRNTGTASVVNLPSPTRQNDIPLHISKTTDAFLPHFIPSSFCTIP